MSDAFEEAPPPLPPRPSLPFAEVSDDIPLITLPKRSSLGAGHAYSTDSKGKPSHWYRRLGRKNVSPYFTDFRGQHAPSTKALGTSTTEMQDEAHLPPKPFKRKRNWNHWYSTHYCKHVSMVDKGAQAAWTYAYGCIHHLRGCGSNLCATPVAVQRQLP